MDVSSPPPAATLLAAGHCQLDSEQFSKLCRECKVTQKGVSASNVDAAFEKCKAKGAGPASQRLPVSVGMYTTQTPNDVLGATLRGFFNSMEYYEARTITYPG